MLLGDGLSPGLCMAGHPHTASGDGVFFGADVLTAGRMSKKRNNIKAIGKWLRGMSLLVPMLLLAAPPAAADEMSVVFDQLLSQPDNPALNIRYAELAMTRGETRKALSAYERVLARDPDNREARRAYKKIKRQLQPAVTAFTLATGFSWESNPHQVSRASVFRDSDAAFEASLVMFDERSVASHRWRTLGLASGHAQFELSDLNDASLFIVSGPVLDLGARTRLHVAPGAAAAWLDSAWAYRDAVLQLTLERLHKGANNSVTAVIRSRETNSKFGGDDGLIVQVNGRFIRADVFKQGDRLYLLPRLQVSGPGGSGPGRIFKSSLFPGDFIEYGGRVVYYKPVAGKRLFLGAGIGVYHRDYNQNVALGVTNRSDVMVEPSAHLIVPNVRGSKLDFRVDYRYEHNDSNDPLEDFGNHVISAKTVRRF